MNTYKAPDVKAPRFKTDRKEIICKEFFEKFKTAHPEHKITYLQFKKVIWNHSGKMWEGVIENRDGIELPSGGVIFLGTYKPKYPAKVYDKKASIKAGRRILHRNHKTDGHIAKIFYCYSMSKAAPRRRSLWMFKAGRTFSRTVAKTFPDRWKQYIYWPDVRKITKEAKRHRYRNVMEKRTERAMENYNEFDLN